MIGLGIDTGGTYTDAVIYDFEKQEVKGKAKALTTKEDLTIGIRNALLGLLEGHAVQGIDFLALSTTLATNACVEQIQSRAKLIFIGVEEKTVAEMRDHYGLPPVEEILFLPKPLRAMERDLSEVLKEALAGYESAAIVEIFAREDNGRYEKKVREEIRALKKIPCMIGSEMFQERNVLQRGASVLLNARLLPVIRQFQESVHTILNEFHRELPVLIVRSDGSLMSMDYTREHPVETILSGPAASVIAGMELTKESKALVVDMGGTTTDVAIIKDGSPLLAADGIHIGGWRTFVKGVFIDTFGLGGDSAVRVTDGKLYLDERRVIPLCHLIAKYPELITDLEELVMQEKGGAPFPMHEFLVLQRDIEGLEGYSEAEKRLCRALAEKPLILKKAADAVERDLYNFKISERLEREGVIIRSGLTPTDIMHIKGDYRQYRTDASKLGARFVAGCVGLKSKELCEAVYDLVRRKLYGSLMRILMEHEYPVYHKLQNQPGGKKCFEQMIETSYQAACSKKTAANLRFTTDAKLIGIGAPIHVFLKDVAELLGTEAVIPEHAEVANALGAVLGNVQAQVTLEVIPEYAYEGISGYNVQIGDQLVRFEDHEDAIETATAEAKQKAEELLRQRGGIPGEIRVEIERHAPQMGSGTLLLKEVVKVSVQGKNQLEALI